VQEEGRCRQEAEGGEGQPGGDDPSHDGLIMEMADEYGLNCMGEVDEDEDDDEDEDEEDDGNEEDDDDDRGDAAIPPVVAPPAAVPEVIIIKEEEDPMELVLK
jgi:hypothetical protein